MKPFNTSVSYNDMKNMFGSNPAGRCESNESLIHTEQKVFPIFSVENSSAYIKKRREFQCSNDTQHLTTDTDMNTHKKGFSAISEASIRLKIHSRCSNLRHGDMDMLHKGIFTILFTFDVRPERLNRFSVGRNVGIQPLRAMAPMCLF